MPKRNIILKAEYKLLITTDALTTVEYYQFGDNEIDKLTATVTIAPGTTDYEISAEAVNRNFNIKDIGGEATIVSIPTGNAGSAGAVESVNGQQGIVVLTSTDLGLGNVDNTSDLNKPVSTAQQAALDLKADASAVSNVDNTSDLNKPVSTAQQAALDLKQDLSEKDAANGYAGLNSSSKIAASALPTDAMQYKGTYNASTNTPSLSNGVGTTGDQYKVSVAGTRDFGAGPITLDVGDLVLYDGTVYEAVAKDTSLTAGEIKTLYESNANTNEFSDAEKSKLAGIEDGATGDQTGAEIKLAYEAELDTNAYTDAEKAKLAGVESGATGDQTGAEIKLAYEAEANTNAYTDAEKTKLAGVEAGATGDQTAAEVPYDNSTSGLVASTAQDAIDELDAALDALPGGHDPVTLNAGDATQESANLTGQELTLNQATTISDGVMSSEDKTKLDGVESGATADQTGAEIKLAYEGEANTNAYTDAEKAKLAGVESGATADQTGAEIKLAYEAELDTNAYTDAEKSKLAGIESGATADQTGAEIKAAYEAELDTNAYTDAEKTKLAGIEALADVTDEANVTDALDGATLLAATVAGTDKVLIQDTDGADALKTVTAQSIADLAAGAGDNLGNHTATQNLDMGAFAITNVGNVDGRDVSADGTKLDGIEALADVTDEANVTDALDGATLVAATVAANDKVLIQDTDGADVLKTVTAQAIADLGGGGGGETNDVKLVHEFAISPATSFTIDNTYLTGTHRHYLIRITNVTATTALTGFSYRTSSNNGVSFDAGTSYNQATHLKDSSPTNASYGGNGLDRVYGIIGTPSTTAGLDAEILLKDVHDATKETKMEFKVTYKDGANVVESNISCVNTNAAIVDAIEVGNGVNNMTAGHVQIYGIK